MRSEAKVGLAVMAAILGFYLFLSWVTHSGLWSQDQQTLPVLFANVEGLLEGDPVDIRGYEVGKVADIEVGENGVMVTLLIDGEVKLREDAYAEIRVKEILGGKQVALLPGTSEVALPTGQVLPGQNSLDFSTIFSTLGRVMEGFEPERVQQFLDRFDTLTLQISRLAQAVEPAEVRTITSNLARTSEDLGQLVGEFRQRRSLQRADSLLRNLNGLAQTADASLLRVNELAGKFSDQTLPQADSLFSQLYATLDQADGMLTDAEDMLQNLKNKNTALGYLINDQEGGMLLDSTLQNLNRTLDHIRRKKIHVGMSLRHKPKVYKE